MSWGAVAVATIGAGASIYGASQSKGASGGVADWQAPQYSFTEPRLQQTSDYLSNMMSRLSRGEYPAYYERLAPKVRQRQQNALYQQYFGTEGNRRGAYNLALESGAVQGVGPGQGFKRASQTLDQYSLQSQQIDQLIDQIGIDIMNQQSLTVPQISASLPMGPQAQPVSYSTPAYTSPWSTFGSSLMGLAGNTVGEWKTK